MFPVPPTMQEVNCIRESLPCRPDAAARSKFLTVETIPRLRLCSPYLGDKRANYHMPFENTFGIGGSDTGVRCTQNSR